MIEHSNLNHLQLSSTWIPTTDPWDFYHMHPFMQFTKQSHKIHLRRHQCSPLRPLRGHFVLRKQRRTVGGARKFRAQRTNGCRNIGVILGANKRVQSVVEYATMSWTPKGSNRPNAISRKWVASIWFRCFPRPLQIWIWSVTWMCSLGCFFKRVTFPIGWDFHHESTDRFSGFETCSNSNDLFSKI